MQVTNNKTTIELNEQKILNMICDPRIEKMERIFKTKYQVKVITALPETKFYMFLYLCIVVLNLKARELADIYDLTIYEIRQGTKKVFEQQHTDKAFYGILYGIYITFNQQIKVA